MEGDLGAPAPDIATTAREFSKDELVDKLFGQQVQEGQSTTAMLEQFFDQAVEVVDHEQYKSFVEALLSPQPRVFIAHEDADGQAAMAMVLKLRRLWVGDEMHEAIDTTMVMPVGLGTEYYEQRLQDLPEQAEGVLIDMNDQWLLDTLQSKNNPLSGKIVAQLDHHKLTKDRATVAAEGEDGALLTQNKKPTQSISSSLLALGALGALVHYDQDHSLLDPEQLQAIQSRFHELALLGMIGDLRIDPEEIQHADDRIQTIVTIAEHLNLMAARPLVAGEALEKHFSEVHAVVAQLSDESIPLHEGIGQEYAKVIKAEMDMYWDGLVIAANDVETGGIAEYTCENGMIVSVEAHDSSGGQIVTTTLDQSMMPADQQRHLAETFWKEYVLKQMKSLFPDSRGYVLGVVQIESESDPEGYIADIRVGTPKGDDTGFEDASVVVDELVNNGGHSTRAGGYYTFLKSGIPRLQQLSELYAKLRNKMIKK